MDQTLKHMTTPPLKTMNLHLPLERIEDKDGIRGKDRDEDRVGGEGRVVAKEGERRQGQSCPNQQNQFELVMMTLKMMTTLLYVTYGNRYVMTETYLN